MYIDLYQGPGEVQRHCGTNFPTLILSGNASSLGQEQTRAITTFFEHLAAGLGYLAGRYAILDGGTDKGVIHLLGDALERTGTLPERYIGVFPRFYYDKHPDRVEPHHTHIFLTDGEFGEEVPVMGQIRQAICRPAHTCLLLVDGGRIALLDMAEHARADIPLYVLLGSGILPQGFADAQAGNPHPYPLESHRALLATGLVRFVSMAHTVRSVVEIVSLLSGEGRA
jgi:hypothetical protein